MSSQKSFHFRSEHVKPTRSEEEFEPSSKTSSSSSSKQLDSKKFNAFSLNLSSSNHDQNRSLSSSSFLDSSSSLKKVPFKSEKMNPTITTTSQSFDFSKKTFQPVLEKTLSGTRVLISESTDSSSSSVKKNFRFICVLDFEAVFSEDCKTNRNYDMEIIEFPSVLLEYESPHKLRVVDQIQNYVQTRRIPKLNSECTAVTGITQEMVDNGVSFEKALTLHTEWLSKHLNGEEPSASNVLMTTCGDWDLKTMIPHQVFHEKKCIPLVKSHLSQWCNVKEVYGRFMDKQKVNGMLTMLNGLNLELEGKHHSGIDDCKNIARVICELVSRGCSLDVTARLTCKHGECSRTKNSQVEHVSYNPKIALNNFVVQSRE